MTQPTRLRLLAIRLIFTFAAFAAHAASHWHAQAYDDAHCQACHVGHAAIPATQLAAQRAAPVGRFAPLEAFTPDLESVRTLSVPEPLPPGRRLSTENFS